MDNLINDILDSLEDLRFNEISELELVAACDLGPKSPFYTKLVSQLSTQLQKFHNISEVVNQTKDANESESFLFEISGFLREYGCPYPTLTDGDVTKRLSSKQDCLYLLLFLTSEVQSTRINECNTPTSQPPTANAGNFIFQCLKTICVALNMSRPPDDITVSQFFSGIAKKLSEAVAKCHHLPKPVIKQKFGPLHWEKLDEINKFLQAEYATRKAMLLKRLDVTILSFNWSEKAKSNVDNIANAYQSKRHSLTTETRIDLSDLLASRDDITNFKKTSSGETRFECRINKVKMGNVPDRGGRTEEIRPPPPEMPSWQKRQAPPPQQQRQGRGDYHGNKTREFSNNKRSYSGRGGRHNNDGGGNEDNRGSRPQSGRGGKWRGRGGNNRGRGAFEQAFQGGGQSDRRVYHS